MLFEPLNNWQISMVRCYFSMMNSENQKRKKAVKLRAKQRNDPKSKH